MTFARFLLIALLSVSLPALADDVDHERAREAVKAGKIEPLSKALGVIEKRFPGNVLEVELEEKRAGFKYEIKILSNEGRVVKVDLDAKTLEILDVEGDDGD